MKLRKDSMNKYKIVAVISGALTVLQLIPFIPVIWNGLMFSFDIKVASAIGIIGHADGPTSIVVAHVFNPVFFFLVRYGFLLLCGLTCIVSTILYFKKKKQ